MPATSKRVSRFTESVIRRMTRVANRYGAINLSQGFPDFDPPPEVCRALERAAREGPHQYAITWGAADFRKGLADKHRRFSGAEIDPEGEIVVTCGSTEAMMAAMLAVCDPGDRVVVFSPFYENYAADAILSGAEPLHVMLRPPAFTFDPAELRAAFEQGRPKALVLCNPANPSGRVFTLDECRVIAELAQEFDAFVITDEVYEHIVYPPHRHVYISTLPGMRERTLVCNSLSKTYSITGWRLGYVIGPPAVMDGVRKVHDFLTVGAAAPLQAAALAGLALPDSYYAEMATGYLARRDLFLAGLDAAGLPYFTPEGAYYVLCDVSPYGVTDDTAFCEWLAEHVGVAAVPGSSFFHEPVNHLIRFHFAKREETLRAALERLRRLPDLAPGRTG